MGVFLSVVSLNSLEMFVIIFINIEGGDCWVECKMVVFDVNLVIDAKGPQV